MLAANVGRESSWGSPDAVFGAEEEHAEPLEEDVFAAMRADVYSYGTLKHELTSSFEQQRTQANDTFLSGHLLAFVLSGGSSVSDGRLGKWALPL